MEGELYVEYLSFLSHSFILQAIAGEVCTVPGADGPVEGKRRGGGGGN